MQPLISLCPSEAGGKDGCHCWEPTSLCHQNSAFRGETIGSWFLCFLVYHIAQLGSTKDGHQVYFNEPSLLKQEKNVCPQSIHLFIKQNLSESVPQSKLRKESFISYQRKEGQYPEGNTRRSGSLFWEFPLLFWQCPRNANTMLFFPYGMPVLPQSSLFTSDT